MLKIVVFKLLYNFYDLENVMQMMLKYQKSERVIS